MYGQSSARDILLLAAEDAFEFERWRDAGPVTADIDPEVKAAEIAEFEALGIPMPSELDSLRRELEHAPKVREAIRHSSLALRRGGRASASSLVALGPQQLMPMGAGGMPWGWPMGMDPRLAAAAMDPRVAARLAPEPRRGRSSRVAAAAEVDASMPEPLDEQPSRARTRKGEPVEAEVVDDDFDDDELDDDDDELDDERPHSKAARVPRGERRDPRRRVEPRRARAARPRDEWDDDDDDDRFESAVAARPARSDAKLTWILGGVSTVAVLGLLWFAINGNKNNDVAAVAQQQQQQQPLQQQAAPVQPPPPLEAVGAVDPATGLPLGQALAPAVEPTPAPAQSSGRRGSGVSAVRGSSAATPSTSGGTAGGGVNPFAGYKTPDDPGALGSKPAAATPPPGGAATQPAAAPPSNGAAPNGVTEPAAAAGGAAAGAAGAAAATPAPGTEAKPAEPPKPAEEPKPEEPQLTKSKMTPAIREAVIGRVGDLQACYQDAVVGKPDLAGQVVFTISLDQDGVVKKVEIAKDEVKYGVAKCAAKKIQRWTLPSAGIPIIFDLPFDFKS
ncbi:MAG TPA: AgmX/PglI C-terminal domain-containing protein [Enhygromyxa sp.]|nr:AgmX/PglI C-terminal domain-containing protein [Enhygromyxa sp.]